MLQQALQHLNWHELLAILAQRNEQLQQAESRATQLQEQLQQQQSETETQLAAACSQQQAAELRADKVQKESMKQVLVLEVSSQVSCWHTEVWELLILQHQHQQQRTMSLQTRNTHLSSHSYLRCVDYAVAADCCCLSLVFNLLLAACPWY